MKFFLLTLLYISINLTHSHGSNTVVLSGLVSLIAWNCWIIYKKHICRTFGSSLAASLEPLGHCQNEASLSLFYRYYFGRCLSKLTQLVPLPYSWGRSTHYSDRLPGFSVCIPRCFKNVYVNSFFPCTARIWIFCL